MDDKFIKASLTQTKGFQQAVFTSYLLTYLPKKEETLLPLITEIVTQSNKSEEVEGIALGAFTSAGPAIIFRSDSGFNSPNLKNARVILDKVDDKLAAIKDTNAATASTKVLLKIAGIGKDDNNGNKE